MKIFRRPVPKPTPGAVTTPRVSRTTTAAANGPKPAPGHSGIDAFVMPRKGARSEAQENEFVGTVRTSTRRTHPYDLTYQGGRVLKNPELQHIYVGAYWVTPEGKADAQYNDAFGKEVVGSSHQALLAQYGVGKGSFGGSTVAGTTRDPATFSKADVIALVQQQIASGAVKDGPETVHMVVLPPGTVLEADGGVTSKDGLGGFHGSYTDASGKNVYFGVLAYSQGDNGIDFTGNARDNLSIVESHELDEAATDPDVGNGRLGWYNAQYGEIGDLAVNSGLVPLDKAWGRDSGGYAVQVEWDNANDRFEANAPTPRPPRPRR